MTKTRRSTQKHEIVHPMAGVVLTGVSKTEATQIARGMNKGARIKVWVRPVAFDRKAA